MAYKLARHRMTRWPEWSDEIESAALMGLVLAARSFNPAFASFSHFAHLRITGMILNEMKLCTRRKRSEAVLEFDPEDDQLEAERDGIDAVEFLLGHLPESHARVCRMRFLGGLTQAQIGRRIGISVPTVQRIQQESFRRLRKVLGVSGPDFYRRHQ